MDLHPVWPNLTNPKYHKHHPVHVFLCMDLHHVLPNLTNPKYYKHTLYMSSCAWISTMCCLTRPIPNTISATLYMSSYTWISTQCGLTRPIPNTVNNTLYMDLHPVWPNLTNPKYYKHHPAL